MMQYACRVSPFDVDLQIIQQMPQVKMPLALTSPHFRTSLGFKQLARRLHVEFFEARPAGPGFNALLAATAVIGISLRIET